MRIKIGIASLIGIALLLAWFAKPQPFAKVLADSRIPLRRDTQTNGVWVKLDDEAALMNALHRAGYTCSQNFQTNSNDQVTGEYTIHSAFLPGMARHRLYVRKLLYVGIEIQGMR